MLSRLISFIIFSTNKLSNFGTQVATSIKIENIINKVLYRVKDYFDTI